jgi:hypothetical protein
MSHKHYQFKLIEAADGAEFETLVKHAGTQHWSAVGYGVLPDGRRSALMERKTRVNHSHKHKDRNHDDQHEHHHHDVPHNE